MGVLVMRRPASELGSSSNPPEVVLVESTLFSLVCTLVCSLTPPTVDSFGGLVLGSLVVVST